MVTLPPTARLVLFSLKDIPGQTFLQLIDSTATRNNRTLRDALRLLLVAGLIVKSDSRPAVYSLPGASQ